MKCSFGMTWNSSNNICTGSATDTQFCNFVSSSGTSNDCNGGNASNELGVGGFLNGATSSLYNACNGLNSGLGTYGKTNWRVPTIYELKLLLNCTDKSLPTNGFCGTSNYSNPAINPLFPNIPISFSSSVYWSSTTASSSINNASNLDFFGPSVSSSTKSTTFWYVRCVS